MTADVDDDGAADDGVVFALGDWFGGYALYAGRRDRRTSPSPAPSTRSSWRTATPLATGRHEIAVTYALGAGRAARPHGRSWSTAPRSTRSR